MKIISIRYCLKKYFHLKLTNYQPLTTYSMASHVTYCILGTLIKTSFGDIVYFEPKNIQYKKLVNGVINQSKVSLIDGDGNKILSNFKMFVSLYYDCMIFYPMKNISRTSELPVRSCENRRFPL